MALATDVAQAPCMYLVANGNAPTNVSQALAQVLIVDPGPGDLSLSPSPTTGDTMPKITITPVVEPTTAFPVGKARRGGSKQVITQNGSIEIGQGDVWLDSTTALQVALPPPPPDADGLRLFIMDVGGAAHVVTPIGGDVEIAFDGMPSSCVDLVSYGGNWYAHNTDGTTIE